MEKVQNQPQIQGTTFRGAHRTTSNPIHDNKAQNIENGNKKSMEALKWMGIIGASALAVGGTAYLIKSGKGKQAVDIVKDKGKKTIDKVKDKLHKNTSKAGNVVKKGTKEAQKLSQEVIATVPEETQKAVNSAKNGISHMQSDIKHQQKALKGLQAEETKLQGELTKATTKKAKNALQTQINEVQGKIADANSQITEISNRPKAFQEALAKNPQQKAVVDMQKAKRKHPELSQDALKKLYQNGTAQGAQATIKAPTQEMYQKYLNNVQTNVNKGARAAKAKPMTYEQFTKKYFETQQSKLTKATQQSTTTTAKKAKNQARAMYDSYKAMAKKQGQTPMSFTDFVTKNGVKAK